MDLERINKFRRLVVVALFADDEFMDLLVLKGGNAIDLIHGVAQRGSLDLDFSLESDFPNPDVPGLRERFEKLLNASLNPEGFTAIDVSLLERPDAVSPDLRGFWGGYRLEFKIIVSARLQRLRSNARAIRAAAEETTPEHHRVFSVDISRHEYCRDKEERELDGFTIYVYSPVMIVCEKLRALCQQTRQYRKFVRSEHSAPRAKDFFDVHTLVTHYGIDLTTPENRSVLRAIFDAKRVDTLLLREVANYREFHRAGFGAVRDTVKPGVHLLDFDEYFDFVVRLIDRLEPLGNV